MKIKNDEDNEENKKRIRARRRQKKRRNECNNLIMKTLPNNNIDVHLHNVASY